MRRARPSRTSSLVTLLRALAHEGVTEVEDFKDPTAFSMLPLPWRLLTRLALRRMRSPSRSKHPYLKDGRFDLVPLRTRVFDEAWHAAHAAGTRQLVLLGAGLDGRAFRLPDIGDTGVFEVDHPATQRLKRRRARALTPKAERHVFVPVDFERDRLEEALQAAGLRRDQPTFWIWEGVTPYLTGPAQRATLAAIAKSSAPGSRLAMTYVEPAQTEGDLAGTRRLVRFLGEPFVGLLTRAQAAQFLLDSGHALVEDTGLDDWRKRYTANSTRPSSGFRERIAVAERGL